MKILFLSRWFPFPPNNGSKLRIYNILRGLAQHHDVTLLSFSDHPTIDRKSMMFCSDVHVIPWREFDPNSWRAKLGFLSLKPRSIIDTHSTPMAGKISELVNTCKYDIVIASELSMAAYHQYFRHVPAIFEDLEIGICLNDLSRRSGWWKRLRHTLTWLKLRRYLIHLIRSFQVVTVVSDQELLLVQQNLTEIKDIVVIPNGIDVNSNKGINVEPELNTLIFTGSFRYNVNYEAMQWFVGKVFPLVLEKKPSTKLIITGDHANLPLPSIKNVVLTGYVANVQTLIASSTVALAPIWSGGGTRLKILEAMALGIPVVATSKGAEGLLAQHGRHLMIADDPDKFAEYVINLLQDDNLRKSISFNATQLVKDNYDWQILMPQFLRLVEKTASG